MTTIAASIDSSLVREERAIVEADMRFAHQEFLAAPIGPGRAFLLSRVIGLAHQHANLLAWERHLAIQPSESSS